MAETKDRDAARAARVEELEKKKQEALAKIKARLDATKAEYAKRIQAVQRGPSAARKKRNHTLIVFATAILAEAKTNDSLRGSLVAALKRSEKATENERQKVTLGEILKSLG